VQEGLTNARKHAPGQSVRVLIDTGQAQSLTVELRNSLAAQAFSSLPGAGVGLAGLSERVRLAGGDLEHELGAGEFRLSARLPA
jgi:signal transduction histidine kinase